MNVSPSNLDKRNSVLGNVADFALFKFCDDVSVEQSQEFKSQILCLADNLDDFRYDKDEFEFVPYHERLSVTVALASIVLMCRLFHHKTSYDNVASGYFFSCMTATAIIDDFFPGGEWWRHVFGYDTHKELILSHVNYMRLMK